MKNLKGFDDSEDREDYDNNQNVAVQKNSQGNPSISNTSRIASYLGGRDAQHGEVAMATSDGARSLEQGKQGLALEVPKRGHRLREKVEL